MNIQEIKQAIANGKIVCWSNTSYVVITNSVTNELYLKFIPNGHIIGIESDNGELINAKEEELFIMPENLGRLTEEGLGTVIETREPKGLFYCEVKDGFVLCDNRTGDAWTEDYNTFPEMINSYFKEEENSVKNTEMSIQELKAIMTRKHSELFKTFGLFFAFTDKQFEENKTPIKEGAKYIHIGGNGYLPEYNVEGFKKGMEDINQWYNAEISKEGMREKLIAHELINYECYYIGSIDDALDSLGEGFTAEEVQAVFNKNYQQYMEDNG